MKSKLPSDTVDPEGHQFLHNWTGSKIRGCYLVRFFISSNFYRLDLHNKTCIALANPQWNLLHRKTCVALSNLQRNICKNWIENRTSLENWKGMFVDFLIGHIGPPIVFTIMCRIVVKIWRRSVVYFKHVSLWCLLFDPHWTTYQSNILVQLRERAT